MRARHARLYACCGLAMLGAPAALGLSGCGKAAPGAVIATAPAASASARAGAALRVGASHAGVPLAPGAQTTRPAIRWDPIPFPARRKREMAAYARRHYGLDTYRLVDPHVIVEHYTDTPDFQSTYDTFAPDRPDSELHELPNTCAHFVVDRDGTIHQLVALTIMCRHTVGLNYTPIGSESVGYSDGEVRSMTRVGLLELRAG